MPSAAPTTGSPPLTLFVFGDTFEEAGVGGGWWRSPVALYGRLNGPGRAVVWTGAVGGQHARQLWPHDHDTSEYLGPRRRRPRVRPAHRVPAEQADHPAPGPPRRADRPRRLRAVRTGPRQPLGMGQPALTRPGRHLRRTVPADALRPAGPDLVQPGRLPHRGPRRGSPAQRAVGLLTARTVRVDVPLTARPPSRSRGTAMDR